VEPMNTGLGALPSVESLAIDPITPATLYTCISAGYSVEDGGANWLAANNGLSSTDVLASRFNRAIRHAVRQVNAEAFQSTNSAGNWVAMNTGSRACMSIRWRSIRRTRRRSMPDLRQRISRAAMPSDLDGRQYRVDRPAHGTPLAIDRPIRDGLCRQQHRGLEDGKRRRELDLCQRGTGSHDAFGGGSFNALAVDPASPATVYLELCWAGFYKSVDGRRPERRRQRTEHAAGGAGSGGGARQPGHVYAGTLWARAFPGGIFKSPNGGAGWTALSFGLNGVQSLPLIRPVPPDLTAGPP